MLVLDENSPDSVLMGLERHADRSAFARDLIYLLTMRAHWGEVPAEALDTPEAVYGPAVSADFERAACALRDDPRYLARCFAALSVSPDAQAVVRKELFSF